MRTFLDRDTQVEASCGCEAAFEDGQLLVDADDCPGGGVLAEEPACRATVVGALTDRDAGAVVVRAGGVERAYEGDAAALLVAAGRFADAVAFHDGQLAERARRDPLGAARAATGRAGPVPRIAAESGLEEGAKRADGYGDALRPSVGPVVSRARLVLRPPADARFDERRELETGGTVRIYDRPGVERRTYHLEPVEYGLEAGEIGRLGRAYEVLADGIVPGGKRAPGRAVRQVADEGDPVLTLERVLEKHTRGFGVLEDLFADPRVSDVFATAPVAETSLRIRVDGEAMRTNVWLTEAGLDALASRLRRASGRAFSRADPTLDATVTAGGRRVRVAGVTEPASDGAAFALRAHERESWTLPALVGNNTLTPESGSLLSLAVERGAAALIAGPRSAGKTTLLGALLWELPATTRTVVIEDTPELPVGKLRETDRDVQRLLASTGDGSGLSPTAALRTGLRLGEGAIVVGEVRGEEASVLYEAMRVGANASAVLGTIHGDGGAAVRERVVTDLGVPASSFAATDLLTNLELVATGDEVARRVRAIEEAVREEGTVTFESLYERNGGELQPTGRIARGNSRLVGSIAGPEEPYAAVREALSERATWLSDLSTAGRIGSEAVARAHARRRC